MDVIHQDHPRNNVRQARPFLSKKLFDWKSKVNINMSACVRPLFPVPVAETKTLFKREKGVILGDIAIGYQVS